MQKYEKGINRIGASRLFDLSHVLGVPVQFFYDEAPAAYENTPSREVGFAERQTESYITEFLNTRDGLELNKAFVRISDIRVRRAIVDLVRSLAGEAKCLKRPDCDADRPTLHRAAVSGERAVPGSAGLRALLRAPIAPAI